MRTSYEIEETKNGISCHGKELIVEVDNTQLDGIIDVWVWEKNRDGSRGDAVFCTHDGGLEFAWWVYQETIDWALALKRLLNHMKDTQDNEAYQQTVQDKKTARLLRNLGTSLVNGAQCGLIISR